MITDTGSFNGLTEGEELGLAEHDAFPCTCCTADPLSPVTLAELESGWPSPLTDSGLQLGVVELIL